MTRAVAYLRVSQKDENIENQKVKIVDFAKSRGFDIVGFFADIDISGTTKPRERPQYRAMLEFCRMNGVKIIIFYDLSRLARDVIEGLNELKRLADEGYNIFFAGMDFLNYDMDPMMKKKIIMDFLWFAEMYVSDVKRRTKNALERLKREGRVYTKPRIIHYLARWLSDKEAFSMLTPEDIDQGKRMFTKHLDVCLDMEWSIYRCWKEFWKRYERYLGDKAPRSYIAFYREVKRYGYWDKFKRITSTPYRRR